MDGMDCVWTLWCFIDDRGLYLYIKNGWPLRGGRGEGQNLNGQMPLKDSKIDCRWPLNYKDLVFTKKANSIKNRQIGVCKFF